MNDHQVLAAVAVVVVMAMALWLALRALRRADALEKQQALIEAELAGMRDTLAEAGIAVVAAERDLAGLERRLGMIAEQQEQLKLRDETGSGYSHAIRLAQQGSSAEDLVRDCGLNRGEAELVVSLHGKSGTG